MPLFESLGKNCLSNAILLIEQNSHYCNNLGPIVLTRAPQWQYLYMLLYLFSSQTATEGDGIDVIIEMLANVNLQKDLELLSIGGTVAVSMFSLSYVQGLK